MTPTTDHALRDQDDATVISIADYRRRRFGPPDGDSTPPPPCPLAARPLVERARIETKPPWLWSAEPRRRSCRMNSNLS
jgi:hypothetical protein